MRIVRDLVQAHPALPASVTIGVFDGVHCGHQQLIVGMVTAAHAAGRVAAADTFDPHPATAMGHEPPPLLTTVDERAEVLATLGIDILVVPSFTPATARIGAAEFASLLVTHLDMVELWAGPGFALGYQREGDVPYLTRLGDQMGFVVRVVEPMVCEGTWVSSSRIRAALRAGELSWATSCLGRPYRLAGTVAHGGRLARVTGLPVATLAVSANRLMPAEGAYAGLAHTADLGRLPAVGYVEEADPGPNRLHGVEVFLLDVKEIPQGQRLALDFIASLRGGGRLLSRGASRRQVLEDAERARALLSAAG